MDMGMGQVIECPNRSHRCYSYSSPQPLQFFFAKTIHPPYHAEVWYLTLNAIYLLYRSQTYHPIRKKNLCFISQQEMNVGCPSYHLIQVTNVRVQGIELGFHHISHGQGWSLVLLAGEIYSV